MAPTKKDAENGAEAPTHPTLAAALVAAQKDMPPVKTDSVNPHFNSKFASLSHVAAEVLPVFARHGLAVIQQPCVTEAGVGVRTIVLHEGGDQWDMGRFVVTPTKRDPQGAVAAVTYTRRVTLCAIAGVAPDPDDDGNSVSAQPAETPAQTRSAPPPQRPTAANPAQSPVAGKVTVTGVVTAVAEPNEYGWADVEVTGDSGETFTGRTKIKPLLGAATLYHEAQTRVRAEISSKPARNPKYGPDKYLDTLTHVDVTPTSDAAPTDEPPAIDESDLPF